MRNLPDWASEGEVEAGGGLLAYIEAGPDSSLESDLPPIVFIHGAGGSRNGWLLLLHDLSRRGLHALALELPGHGASPGPGRRSIGEYALLTREFIGARGLAEPVLAGHSMGGAVALACGLDAPGGLSGLILIGTGARLRVKTSILAGIEADFESAADEMMGALFSPSAPAALIEEGRRQLLECPPDVVLGDFAACDAFDERERLGEIRLPSLVLCGREDLMTPPKYSEYLAEKISSARLQIFENAGHMLMVESHARVAEEIRGFIQGL